MDDRDQQRKVRHRLAVLRHAEEITGNVAATCRYYGIIDRVVIDDTQLFNDKLQEWEDFYNVNRPHGSLGGQAPYERLRQKTTTRPRKRPTSVAHLAHRRQNQAGRRRATVSATRNVPATSGGAVSR